MGACVDGVSHVGWRPELGVGTSWYHATHMSWVMKRVLKLSGDDEYRNVEDPELPGTFFIISPYKVAQYLQKGK